MSAASQRLRDVDDLPHFEAHVLFGGNQPLRSPKEEPGLVPQTRHVPPVTDERKYFLTIYLRQGKRFRLKVSRSPAPEALTWKRICRPVKRSKAFFN